MSSLPTTRLGTGALVWPDGNDSTGERLALGRAQFLHEVRLREPGVLHSLADIAGLDSSFRFSTEPVTRDTLTAWGKRWNLTDTWCLDIARDTIEAWRGPTGELLREHPPVGLGPNPDRKAFLNALDWLPPMFVATNPNPLLDDDEQIPPLDPFFLSWNPLLEEWDSAESRMIAAFQKHIRQHRDHIQSMVYEGEPVRPGSRTKQHFRWLALYQVQRLPNRERFSRATLADVEGVTKQSVADAIKQTAALIGLTLREPNKGGRPSKVKGHKPRTVNVVNPGWSPTRNT